MIYLQFAKIFVLFWKIRQIGKIFCQFWNIFRQNDIWLQNQLASRQIIDLMENFDLLKKFLHNFILRTFGRHHYEDT